MIRIVVFFAAIALARLADSLIGLPFVMASLVLAFWVYLGRQIWLSRKDGLRDLRYNLAMAIVLIVLTAFAVLSMLPLYDAVAVETGWPANPIALLAN